MTDQGSKVDVTTSKAAGYSSFYKYSEMLSVNVIGVIDVRCLGTPCFLAHEFP